MGNGLDLEKFSFATIGDQGKLDMWDYVATSLFMSSQGHITLESTGDEKPLLG